MIIQKILLRRLALVLGASLLLAGGAKAQTPYLGETRCVAFGFAPKGWAMMNGQLLPINQNQALFALLGTQYGGNGVQTFALPNMQGREVLSQGQGPGLSPRVVGDTGGTETVTLNVAQMPAHAHAVAMPGSADAGSAQSPAGVAPAAQARTTLYAPTGNVQVKMAAASVSSAGAAQPINNMQPYLVMNCMIALQGIFPSRN
jgi:microcystin-dependent protein